MITAPHMSAVSRTESFRQLPGSCGNDRDSTPVPRGTANHAPRWMPTRAHCGDCQALWRSRRWGSRTCCSPFFRLLASSRSSYQAAPGSVYCR